MEHNLACLCKVRHHCSCCNISFRLLAKKVLQRFMNYFREKHSALLGGALYLIAWRSMMRNLNNPFRLLGLCYPSFRRVMQKLLLHIWVFFRRFGLVFVSKIFYWSCTSLHLIASYVASYLLFVSLSPLLIFFSTL